jgi:hypothetical protein
MIEVAPHVRPGRRAVDLVGHAFGIRGTAISGVRA